MSDKRRWLYIFLIALIIRLVFTLSFPSPPIGDGTSYDALAVSIASGEGLAHSGVPTSYRPPLYPFYLALIYAVFGHNFLAARICQAVVGSLSCVVIYFLAREVFDKRVSWFAGLVALVYPPFICYSTYRWSLTENLFIFLFAITIWHLLKVDKRPSFMNLGISGVSLGLACLTRPVVLVFPGVIFLWMIWRRKDKWLKSFLVILLFFVLTLSPWTIRNFIVHDTFVPVTTMAGIILWQAFQPDPRGFGFVPRDQIVERFKGVTSEVEHDRLLTEDTLSFIRRNPRKALKLTFVKLLWFWNPFDGHIYGLRSKYNIFSGLIFSFFIVGLITLRRRWKEFLLIYLTIGYFVLVSMIFYGMPRFRLPIEPYLLILASFGLSRLAFSKDNRIRSYLLLLFILCANIGMLMII